MFKNIIVFDGNRFDYFFLPKIMVVFDKLVGQVDVR